MNTIRANFWTILAVLFTLAALWYLKLLFPFLLLYFLIDFYLDIKNYDKMSNEKQAKIDELLDKCNKNQDLIKKYNEMYKDEVLNNKK